MKIPREIRALIDAQIPVNSQRRVVHYECSEGKDAAMSVKRLSNGYIFHCFRCGFEGFVGGYRLPSSQIIQALKNISVPAHMEVEAIQYPKDIQWMHTENTMNSIPIEAYAWLWDGGITDEMIERYEFGWSESFYRVILGIHDEDMDLIAYIGRDVFYKKDSGSSKYILRKQEGLNKRAYFTCHSLDQKVVVVVEDPLSAIRVHEATGFETVALLNTHVGTDLLREYMAYDMILWLDDGQLANMVNVVSQAVEYGINATHISTPKDPKKYNDVAIREFFRERRFNPDGTS
jgi:hypothetical protein